MTKTALKPPSSTLYGLGSIQPLSKNIPPEGRSGSQQADTQEAAAIEDPLDPRYNPEHLPDLDYTGGTRFDLPTPVQLETRGVTSQAEQQEFWSAHTVQKNTVAAKLRSAGEVSYSRTLEDCHSTWTIATCGDCGRQQRFPNRCDNFYCPECMPRLAHEREKSISWWVAEISQPKFVTLTCQNLPDLTTNHIQQFKAWWNKLRRRKFARGWRGGFYSLEVTNRGRGWHLHLHALVDAHWIDGSQLAREWSDITNGLGEIVKVKDARGKEYLERVKSYIVKPEQLATWSADKIVTFIQAFDGCRTFGVFGSLYGKRTQFADWLKTLKEAKPRCSCGSNHVTYTSEAEALFADFCPNQPQSARPPPAGQAPDLFPTGKGSASTQPR